MQEVLKYQTAQLSIQLIATIEALGLGTVWPQI